MNYPLLGFIIMLLPFAAYAETPPAAAAPAVPQAGEFTRTELGWVRTNTLPPVVGKQAAPAPANAADTGLTGQPVPDSAGIETWKAPETQPAKQPPAKE